MNYLYAVQESLEILILPPQPPRQLGKIIGVSLSFQEVIFIASFSNSQEDLSPTHGGFLNAGLLIFMCMSVLCACIPVCHVCAWFLQTEDEGDPLELELRTPKGYNMDAKRLNLGPLEEQMSPLSSPSGMILEPIAL